MTGRERQKEKHEKKIDDMQRETSKENTRYADIFGRRCVGSSLELW